MKNYLNKEGLEYLWSKIKTYVDSKVVAGKSGVYTGPEEPTDEDVDVWIDNDERGVEVVDDLTSTSSMDLLSANMGRELNETKQDKHIVGDTVITDTNLNPSVRLGGTWELSDKGYKEQTIVKTYSTEQATTTIVARISGKVISSRVTVEAKEILYPNASSTATAIGQIILEDIGISGLLALGNYNLICGTYNNQYIFNTTLDTDGKIYLRFSDNFINVGQTLAIYPIIAYNYINMIDSFCDKFYWKKVSE